MRSRTSIFFLLHQVLFFTITSYSFSFFFKKMKFTGITLFVSAAYIATFVSAQKAIVSITSPLPGTKYKAGQDAIISWVNPSVPTIPQIVLAKGPSTALQPLFTIATNVNAKDMKYVWKIPADIESSNECKHMDIVVWTLRCILINCCF